MDPRTVAAEVDDPVSALALAYQAGERERLAALHAAVTPLIRGQLARARLGRPLPGGLEPKDLEQQSWVIVAELALRWRPQLGAFGAYVRVSFAWELERYLRDHSPERHTRDRQAVVRSTGHDELMDVAAEHPGTDGRAWDDRLVCAELLGRLEPRERTVLVLRSSEGWSFEAIARRLGLGHRSTALRIYRRAVQRARAEG